MLLTELAKIPPLGVRDVGARTRQVVPAGSTRRSARRLGSAVGRGGYACATAVVSPGSPNLGHGGGLSRAAGSCRHGGIPCQRRPSPPGDGSTRRPAPIMRTRACFGRSCQGNQTGWSISCRCSASPASRSRPVSRSWPTIPSIKWAAAQHRSDRAAATATAGCSATPVAELVGKPRWDWNTQVSLDRLYRYPQRGGGSAAGWAAHQLVLHGGALCRTGLRGRRVAWRGDFMRIRQDGIGIVNVVTEFLQTRTGARLYCSYGGMFDLGADGYARAMRDEFDAFPPFVTAPTYTTADKGLAWLNRAQCIGLGRVDTKAMRIDYDVYVVSVGGRKHAG